MSRTPPLSRVLPRAAAYDFDVVTDAPAPRSMPPQAPAGAEAAPGPVKSAVPAKPAVPPKPAMPVQPAMGVQVRERAS